MTEETRSSDDLVRWIVERVERAEIPYMVTGSFASSFYGKPRGTQDLDIVIAPDRAQLGKLLEILSTENCYVDDESAYAALRRRGQFNVLDLGTGWKVDLIFRKDRGFSHEEMERAREVDFQGTLLSMTSPEDLVLAKLEWARRSGSERQLDDVVGVVEALGATLDLSYIDDWAPRLEVAELWRRIRPASGGN